MVSSVSSNRPFACFFAEVPEHFFENRNSHTAPVQPSATITQSLSRRLQSMSALQHKNMTVAVL